MAEGAPITTTGGVLSTLNVALGPQAGALPPPLPVAVPAAMDMPMVPSPVILLIVTVRVVLPEPVTETVPLAVPVLFRVTSELCREIDDTPEYVTV